MYECESCGIDVDAGAVLCGGQDCYDRWQRKEARSKAVHYCARGVVLALTIAGFMWITL